MQALNQALTEAGLEGFELVQVTDYILLKDLTGINACHRALVVTRTLGYTESHVHHYFKDGTTPATSMALRLL